MKTPVLSKQQQRQSLSAKKSQNKGLRNVLAQPQDNFWPIVDAEKCPILEELLNKLMPAIKRPSNSIPWSQLRHMKKEERAQAKKEALGKEENVPNPEMVTSIILGINAITRSLEKENVCCILMDANIDPHLLVKHIIHMAQNKKVPILMFPKLKTVTLNTIGFATAACALKNLVMDSPDHHFHPLYMTIYDIFKDIPLPKNTLQLFKDIESSEQTILYKEDKISIEDESEIAPSEPVKFTLSTNVYMYRSSCKERAFVPPSATEGSTSEPIIEKMEHEDFISISKYSTDEYDRSIKKGTRYTNANESKNSKKRGNNVNKTSTNVTYLPLKVKRLQGNANRVKATKISKTKEKIMYMNVLHV
ncbi:PREDICTED: uncharacterized protein LOC108570638 [Habropoda laboriosa]|uniref:uncharacterized protein LOC108570638 n=1 Tax=Habropoda laboriosa TaxID=597456 RepID=UPI00083E2D5E|nr:PREDICTED: uncharacterized protein LOC108570638 [Habropoda laboriosa]